MYCVRNGILLGGGAAALTPLPLSIILKELTMLAAPTGCDGIVNMKAFDQLGNRGSLSSLTISYSEEYDMNISYYLNMLSPGKEKARQSYNKMLSNGKI